MTMYSPRDWETVFGGGLDDIYSLEEQFRQFRTGFRPQWQYTVPLQNLENRLTQRYMLGYPGSQASSDPAAFNNTFREYLGSVRPGNYLQDAAILRSRAQQAANIANMTPQELAETYTPGSPGFNQAAWYRAQYGQGDAAMQNQMNLVNLLAMQRPGGGEYTGNMGRAISNMLNELYQARAAQGDPGTNFLQWYLTQTA